MYCAVKFNNQQPRMHCVKTTLYSMIVSSRSIPLVFESRFTYYVLFHTYKDLHAINDSNKNLISLWTTGVTVLTGRTISLRKMIWLVRRFFLQVSTTISKFCFKIIFKMAACFGRDILGNFWYNIDQLVTLGTIKWKTKIFHSSSSKIIEE